MALTFADLEKVRELEKSFKKNKYNGNNDLPSFTIIKGERPFILSAPHSVKTTEKVMESRDIKLAINLAQTDDEEVARRIKERIIITSPRDIDIAEIKIDEEIKAKIQSDKSKLKIELLAKLLKIDPYVLRYYFYKTASEQPKLSEPYTGAYVTLIAQLIGCHSWVRNNNLEANASVNHQNQAFTQYINDNNIKGHIDLHGFKSIGDGSKYHFELAVGTNRGGYISNYERFKEIIISSFAPYQIFGVDFDTIFQGGTDRALCNQVNRYCNIMTGQWEIPGEFRKPQSRPEDSIRMLSGSIDCINVLIEEVEKGRIYGKVPRS